MSQLGTCARSMFSIVKDLFFSNDHADWNAEARSRHYADYRLFDGARGQELDGASQAEDLPDVAIHASTGQYAPGALDGLSPVQLEALLAAELDALDEEPTQDSAVAVRTQTDEDADEIGDEL